MKKAKTKKSKLKGGKLKPAPPIRELPYRPPPPKKVGGDLEGLSRRTGMNVNELKGIARDYEAFTEHSGGRMEMLQFLQYFGLAEANGCLFATRFFNMVNVSRDRIISFEELVDVVRLLTTGTSDDRMRFLFKLFNQNSHRDDVVSQDEVYAVLRSFYLAQKRTKNRNAQVELTHDEELGLIDTVKEAYDHWDRNNDGVFSLDEFSGWIKTMPGILSFLYPGDRPGLDEDYY